MDPLLEAPVEKNRGFPRFLTCSICTYIIVALVYTLALMSYYVYVHTALVFTQLDSSACSSFTGLSINDVPFYSYAGEPALHPSVSELYCSFDYWVWATDYLRIFLPVFVLGTATASLAFQSPRATGLSAVSAIWGLFELAKAIYLTLYLVGAYDCNTYQFCINRNAAEDANTPNTQFVVAVIAAYVFSLLAFSFIGLDTSIRRAALPRLRINKRLRADDEWNNFGAQSYTANNNAVYMGPIFQRKQGARRSSLRQTSRSLSSANSMADPGSSSYTTVNTPVFPKE